MRRILISFLCCLMLITAVSAASSATDLQSNTVVKSDGTCEVTLTLQLKLEEVPAELWFPLPAQAKDITLNGSPARTSTSGSFRNVDLSGTVHFAGNYTFVIHYALPDSISANKQDQLVLTLHLLSGFAYPIEKMQFAVTLPDQPEKRPEFTSTYHQETVDTLMDLKIEGSEIRGSFLTSLKDHESLTMTLIVPEDMFPQPISKVWRLSTDDILTYLCAVLALIYWLLTMRALPPRRIRNATQPAGLTAGEIGCCLTAAGVDFPMLVVTWAQMGYLLIQLDENGRVLLHKRMDMGNERSEYEVRTFRALFGKRRTVDGTGFHFARLSRKASGLNPGIREYYLPHTGNPKIFLCLCTLIGLISGVSLALSFASDTAWQIILSLLLSPLGAVVCWKIHTGTATIHLRNRQQLYIALACSTAWLILSALAGEWVVAVFLLVSQWLAGLAAAYGGRRNDSGKTSMSEILGLRRYMKSVCAEDLQQILRSNPDYYFNLVPYAMALGVDKAFARQFGSRKLRECTYLTSGMDGHMTATEWNQLLRAAVKAMDDGKQTSLLEKFLGK